MSLWSKLKCVGCSHPRHRHTGSHIKGSKTVCRSCECLEFVDSVHGEEEE